MKRPKALAMISITLTAFVISGCGITIAQSSSNSSDSESSAPASNSPEQNVSDLPPTPQIISTPASSALSEALSNTSESFWLLANHEQYLTGVVTDCHFETYPQKSYICFTRDEKSRTFSSNSKRSHILRTSSRSRRLILSSIVSFAVSLKWTRTI